MPASGAQDQVSIALVGCGRIARLHWRGIQKVAPHLKVTAVVDTRPETAREMAEQTGAEAFTSLSEALAGGDFDAVDIMLPHDLHEEAATAAFAAGKHVVLEKPMAPDLAACERILAAARGAGTVFMIAEQSQYWPDVVRVRELIEEGAIGDVVTARATYFDPFTPDPEDPVPWRFRLDRAGGGVCIDGGAHWIRPLRMWLGEIDEVLGVTGRHIEAMEGESWAHALFRFESGVMATFDAMLCAAPHSDAFDFRVTGTRGELVIGNGRDGVLRLFDADHPDGVVLMDSYPGKLDSYGYELHDFSLAVLEGKDLEASAEYSLGELRAAHAIYRSAASSSWEKVTTP